MELEIPSTEEPVATRRNFPLAISDVDHLISLTWVTHKIFIVDQNIKYL